MQRFCFASKNPKFRVFLRVVEAGGVWADFAPEGEYSTTDPTVAEKLRGMSNFGTDFWEPGGAKSKVGPDSVAEPSVLYKCPHCDEYAPSEAAQRQVQHCNAKRGKGDHKPKTEIYTKEDLLIVEPVVA